MDNSEADNSEADNSEVDTAEVECQTDYHRRVSVVVMIMGMEFRRVVLKH